jgi:hypothetical protein
MSVYTPENFPEGIPQIEGVSLADIEAAYDQRFDVHRAETEVRELLAQAKAATITYKTLSHAAQLRDHAAGRRPWRADRWQMLRVVRSIKAHRTPEVQRQQTVTALLDAWSSVLPSRISSEVLGDYIEDINRRIAAGQRKLVWLRVAAAIFWTGINAIGYALKQLRKGKRST